MSPRRLLPLLVVGLLAGGALWGLVLRDDLVTYRYDQATHADQAPVARVVETEGDEAALSIGSPDGRGLTVQFRDPDGEGWTEPQEVFRLEGRGRDFSDTTAREEAGTVAVLALFGDGDEFDGDDLTVGLVCRDRTCAVQREPGFGGEPQVAPDGQTALLGEDAGEDLLGDAGLLREDRGQLFEHSLDLVSQGGSLPMVLGGD